MRDQNERPVSRGAMVSTIAVVILAAAVAQGFGRFTYGVVLPDIRDDLLNGSNTLAGLLGTANTFAYLAGTLTVAWLGSRFDLVQILRGGMVFSVTGITLAVFAPNGAVLAGALLLMGLGGAAIWIPSPGLATQVVSLRRRGLAVGMMGAGVGGGIVWSGQLANIVENQGRTWRAVYGVHSIVGISTLVLVLAVLRSRSDTRGSSGGFGGFGVLAQMPGWKALTACYAAYGFGYLLVVAFFIARLEDDSGFTSDESSLAFTVFGACTVVGGITLGRISDWFGRRRAMAGGYLTFAGSTLLLLVGSQPWVYIGAVGVGILFGGLATVIAAYIVDHTEPTTYGPSYAAATFAFGVAQVLSPQVGGAIADWQGSFTWVFVLSALVMCCGAAFALALPHDHRVGARR